jgi:hypothetical protein
MPIDTGGWVTLMELAGVFNQILRLGMGRSIPNRLIGTCFILQYSPGPRGIRQRKT